MSKSAGGDYRAYEFESRSRSVADKSRESVKIVKDGIEEELLLVAIPIIFKFKEVVPTTHFESAMVELNVAGDGIPRLRGVCPQMAKLKLFPKLFSFDELTAIAIARLKRKCISLYTEADSARGGDSKWQSRKHGQKRASIFLRYLVGCKSVTLNEDCFAHAIGCGRFQQATAYILKRTVGRECVVGADYKGSFYDAVYAGMWRYQNEQLDCVGRNVLNSVGRGRNLCAKVSPHGDWPQSGLMVGFFLEDQLIDGRNYLLRMRPEEDEMRCLYRVKSRIEEYGIFTIAQDRHTPSSVEHKNISSKECCILPIIIPI